MDKQQLYQKYGNEKIAVVNKKELIEKYNLQEGFNPYVKEVLTKIIKESNFILRYNAEYNKKFKQPIAYIVFKHADNYFVTKRLNGSGEARLFDKMAIGQGGHINPVDDMRPGNIILNSVIREIHEELEVDCNAKLRSRIIGFINDNSNDVSEDHFGIIVLIDISKMNIKIRETDKLEGEFVSKEFIKENYDKLEPWSKVVFDSVINVERVVEG